MMADENVMDLEIRHAVVHVLDFITSSTVLSQKELDLGDDAVYGYLLKHLVRLQDDADGHQVVFDEGAVLKHTFDSYESGSKSFLEMSDDCADRFVQWFTDHPDLQAFDLCVMDYTVSGRQQIAMLVLETQEAWTSETTAAEGVIFNAIVNHHAQLPSSSRKIKTYALIDLKDGSIRYHDGLKTSADKNPNIMNEVLQCSSAPSAKQVIAAVRKIAQTVAEDHDENPVTAVAAAKNYIRENTENDSSFNVEELGNTVFAEKPEMKEAYHQMVEEASLPVQDVPLLPETAKRVSSRQKIRTDTGIEVSFPVEYGLNDDFIQFVNHSDGTITIELKHIGKITSRS